jgi:hypothetical protein
MHKTSIQKILISPWFQPEYDHNHYCKPGIPAGRSGEIELVIGGKSRVFEFQFHHQKVVNPEVRGRKEGQVLLYDHAAAQDLTSTIITDNLNVHEHHPFSSINQLKDQGYWLSRLIVSNPIQIVQVYSTGTIPSGNAQSGYRTGRHGYSAY